MKARTGGWLLLVASFAVGGCVQGAGEIGEGPITLSPMIASVYQRYLDEDYPGYFAVTKDGTRAGYSLCRDSRCMAGLWGLALTSCRDVSAGRTCYIYAHGRNVVWREAEGAPDAADNADDNDADGPRTLLIDWDGIGEEIEVDVHPQQSEERGFIAFMKPGSAGFCSGTYAFDDKINATWSLTCDDETSASGRFKYYSSVDEGDGWGTDDSGRKVRLTLLPPA